MPPEPARQRLVRSWLRKARHDLLAAESLSGNIELLDVAVYHCQQASKKALKAFLVWCDELPRRTHDLRELTRQCGSIDQAFHAVLPAAGMLSPYAVQFRYPGAIDDPSPAEMQEALQNAQGLVAFVVQRLPSEISA